VNLDAPENVLALSPGTITNTGQVNVTTGVLGFSGSGSHCGAFAGAGTLRFGGGAQSLLSGSSVTTASTEISGGSVAVQTGATFNVPSLAITTGTLEVVNAGTTANAGLLALSSGGTLTGAGALASSGLFTWTGGTMSGSGTTFANGGATLMGTGTKVLGDSRRLELAGNSSWSAGAVQMGGGGSTLRNAPASTFTATGANRALTDSGDAATFVNDGTFVVNLDAPTNVLTLSPGTITNSGQVSVATGTMRFGNGAHSLLAGSSVTTATTEIAVGSVAAQTGAVFNVPSLAITTGTLDVVNAGTTANAGSLSLSSGGTLTGAGVLASSGPFTWSGGTMSGSGTTRANAGAALTSGGTKILGGSRRLELVGGSSTWSVGAIQMGGGGAIRALTDSGDTATLLNDGLPSVNLDTPATRSRSRPARSGTPERSSF
jgi:hypothetical protein